MISTGKGLIKPKEQLSKDIFDNKKFGDFYYLRTLTNIDLLDKYDFICEDENYKHIYSRKTIEEDIEQTIDFLNNTEYLDLISVQPINKEIIDILHKTNIMERGVLQSMTSTKRTQVGRIETSIFKTVLSKEIVEKMSILGSCYPYKTWLDKYYTGYSENFTKDRILDKIQMGIDVMNRDTSIHPNTIIIPLKVYNLLFDNELENVEFLTKSNKQIGDMELWLNPHNTNIILYKNDNIDYDPKKSKAGILFSPFYLFGKQIDDVVLPKNIHGLTEDFDIKYDTNKYLHCYSVIEIGYYTSHKFLSLYE